MEQASPDMTAESRRWRLGLLIGCGLAFVAWFVATFECTPLLPYCSTTMGFVDDWNYASGSANILKVESGGPASRAGLRVGDQIYFREVGLRERWRLRAARNDFFARFGEHLRYIVHRGDSVFTATIIPQRVPSDWGAWTDWIAYLTGLWCVVFAGVLAIRRPDFNEAQVLALFLLVVSGFGALTSTIAVWPEVDFALIMIGNALYGAGLVALFVLYFTFIARPISAARRLLTISTQGLRSSWRQRGLHISFAGTYLRCQVHGMLRCHI
jgi:hypothetical protein